MNLVLNAAFPLTARYRTETRTHKVPKIGVDGRPDVTIVAGRPTVATVDEPVTVRVVDERLDDTAQQAREAEVISALAAAVQSLDAIDARLSTRYHGTVDLTTWKA